MKIILEIGTEEWPGLVHKCSRFTIVKVCTCNARSRNARAHQMWFCPAVMIIVIRHLHEELRGEFKLLED